MIFHSISESSTRRFDDLLKYRGIKQLDIVYYLLGIPQIKLRSTLLLHLLHSRQLLYQLCIITSNTHVSYSHAEVCQEE